MSVPLIPALVPVEKLEEDSYDWYARHAEKQTAAANGMYDIILIGDSITHFWETTHGPESYRRLFAHRRVLNLGFGSDRTCNVLWRLEHGEITGQNPKAVIVNIGTNNLTPSSRYPGDGPAETALGIAAVANKLRRMLPAAHIVVMGVFQRGRTFSARREPIRRLNFMLKQILPPEIEFIDISGQFLLPDESDIDTTLFLPGDSTHLSEAGYALWSAALEPVFRRLGI